MRKLLAAAVLSLPLAACYTPADPALTGAVVGGAIGATTGAVIGSASRPAAQCEYDPYYGREVCYRY
jgi:hypothetical protein